MCPMCEKRAQLLLQQQTIVESSPASREQSVPGGKLSLFRNPFKACKHLTHRCCAPLCESQRTSIASGRRSSAIIAPVPSTPKHSGELTYLVSESPLTADDSRDAEPTPVKLRNGLRNGLRKSRKRRGLLKRLKAWADPDPIELLPSSNESSFGACGRKVMAVADELARGGDGDATMPSAATLLAAETDLDDSMSEAVTETNVSETTTIVSMMNLHGSVSSPYEMTTSYRGSVTLKSSAYDDDASSFAIVPRTSMNSSYVGRDGASDTSGLSDRFGELDIGYLSLEESGEGPEFDDTVSISSDQSEHLNLDMHQALDDTVSESDLDQEYSISTDSQEWVTETDDAASILQRFRTHHNRDNNNTGNDDNNNNNNNNNNTPPPLPPQPLDPVPTPKSNDALSVNKNPLFVKHDTTNRKPKPSSGAKETQPQPPEALITRTEYLCSRCGRTESGTQPKNVTTTKTNVVPMSNYFMAGEDQAVVAAKVVVLLGKYGNRKGLRISGLQSNQPQPQPQVLTARKLERLRSMICPHNDAVSAFQNEVARMMLEGTAVPDLDMDVEQFLAGYMKLNSPFYIDLIEDFFKSVCVDCFGHMEKVEEGHYRGSSRAGPHQTPAYAVLKPRKLKSITGKGHSGKLQ